MVLRSTNSEILVVATELFYPGVEQDEIMDQFEEALFLTQLSQGPVERILDVAVFFPRQVILLRCLDRGITQPLGIVARHNELHRREELFNEDYFLIIEILADALGDGIR